MKKQTPRKYSQHRRVDRVTVRIPRARRQIRSVSVLTEKAHRRAAVELCFQAFPQIGLRRTLHRYFRANGGLLTRHYHRCGLSRDLRAHKSSRLFVVIREYHFPARRGNAHYKPPCGVVLAVKARENYLVQPRFRSDSISSSSESIPS